MQLERNAILGLLNEKMPYLRDAFNVTRIGLFGSFARNESTESSDIDLIVEFEKGTANLYELKRELRQYLKKEFNRDVDICREKYIKSFARDMILKETIYVK